MTGSGVLMLIAKAGTCAHTKHSPAALLKSTVHTVKTFSHCISEASEHDLPPTFSSCLIKASEPMHFTQETPTDCLALMAKRARTPEHYGTVAIRQFLAGS